MDLYPKEDLVSIRPFLIIGGYGSTLITCVFTIVLVSMAPGPENDNGMLRYISEGMESHCGWSTTVLGTCTFTILIVHVVAAVHMSNGHAIFWGLLQSLGWNIVLGVVDTGWTLHYVGLAMFLVGNVAYHWIASRDLAYGGLRYQQINIVCILFAVIFIFAASSSILFNNNRELRAIAVSMEFALVTVITFQNTFLVNALDQFKNIHLIFDHR